jgi:nucleotide-binding universal stress UspA family protein
MMKTILIATDFSNASHNASVYGVAFAKAINAKVILFNAFMVPNPAPALNVSISRYDIMMQTDKLLLDDADILDPNRTTIEILCDEGLPADAIVNIANEKKVDFIITGMKGRGESLKKIFGSTSTALAKKTEIPLIVVPEKAKFKKLEIVVFANDSLAIDKGIPKYITEITRLFESKLYVVRVIKNKKIFKVNTPRLLQQTEGVTTFEYSTEADISYALNTFIEMNKADMLVMIPHKHIWLKRLFIKSETKDMIFHTHVPLLILPRAILANGYARNGKKKEQKVAL